MSNAQVLGQGFTDRKPRNIARCDVGNQAVVEESLKLAFELRMVVEIVNELIALGPVNKGTLENDELPSLGMGRKIGTHLFEKGRHEFF